LKAPLHKLLLVACALHLSGAHWAILQVAAWTGMLVERTQSAGVVRAVTTTFDGDHPCGMCTAIEAAQKQERQSQPEFPALKAMEEVKLVMMEFVKAPPIPVGGKAQWSEFLNLAVWRADAPPTPPPRTV